MKDNTTFEIPSNRINWIDVLKGIGIVSVVWGHTGHPYAYLMFFFHMPLFFFISGYLYSYKEDVPWLKVIEKKVRHLIVPYTFYLITITAALYIIAHLKNTPFNETNAKALILGGSMLEGPYGTFWFVTCLFAVTICYDLLSRRLRLKGTLIIFIAFCYFAAYWESRYHQDFFFPGNMDVALFAIVFYAIGNLFRIKKWLEKPETLKILITLSAIYLTYFYYLYFSHGIRFGMDLKHRQYYFFGTGILVPLCTIILLAGISVGLTKLNLFRKIISSLGESSMSIMYLHLFSIYIARHFITIKPFSFMVIGLLLPWVWNKLASNIPALSILALGQKSNIYLTDQPLKKSYNSKTL